MIPFALLIAPLPIVAAALFSGSDKLGLSADEMNPEPGCASHTEINSGSWK